MISFLALTTPSASTQVKDAGTSGVWTGGETTGAKAYDSTALSGLATGVVPTGSVSYSFYANAGCATPAATTQTVALNTDGTVPNSATTAALAIGGYSYQASYSGDGNYLAASGVC